MPDAPCSILDKTIQRARPHANGMLVQHKQSPLSKQLFIQHIAANQTTILAAPPTKNLDVHTVQSTNPKAT
jgi:hypothetical protein